MELLRISPLQLWPERSAGSCSLALSHVGFQKREEQGLIIASPRRKVASLLLNLFLDTPSLVLLVFYFCFLTDATRLWKSKNKINKNKKKYTHNSSRLEKELFLKEQRNLEPLTCFVYATYTYNII